VSRYHRPLVLALASLVLSGGAEAQNGKPAVPLVVTSEWLARQLGADDLVLLHVGEPAAFQTEHLPGARLITFDALAAKETDDGLALELPAPDDLRVRLESLGISDDSRVVVYFAGNWATPATRVLFTLDYAGLGDRAGFLDGGLPQWKREGRPVSAKVTPVARGRLTTRAAKPIVADAEYVRAHLRTRGTTIVDARAPVFYSGPAHGNQRAGHVAGAVSIPFTSVFDDSLRVRDRASLERLFADAGVQPSDSIVAYCHIGQQATAVVLAARLLGRPVRLYDGSFQDWSRRTELPVENTTGASR
jgi:thiosulfate/3-mercaptopyruvate sulfurtransferase